MLAMCVLVVLFIGLNHSMRDMNDNKQRVEPNVIFEVWMTVSDSQ